MTQNKYSSPIPSSIPDEDVDNDSGTESNPFDADWLGPENQLGLEPDDDDDEAVGLDKKGKMIKHHKTM
jgi:hypothetical protein